MSEELPGVPVEDVLSGLAIPALPLGQTPTQLFALIKCVDQEGHESFFVRVTDDLDQDGLLGTLVGYVEYMKQQSAATWVDRGTTKPTDGQP